MKKEDPIISEFFTTDTVQVYPGKRNRMIIERANSIKCEKCGEIKSEDICFYADKSKGERPQIRIDLIKTDEKDGFRNRPFQIKISTEKYGSDGQLRVIGRASCRERV